jgi:heat shock protein HslJ
VRRDTLTVFDADRNTILRFDAAPRNPLLGTWEVDSFETAPSTVSAVLEGTELDVVFRIGSLGGFAGCNSFSGVYGTNGSVVRVSRLATTRLACDEDVMAQEAAFITALEGAAVIEPRGTRLNLTDRNGNLKVALVRPVIEETPGATVAPTAAPTEEPTAEATPTPTPAPTPTPTAAPTPTPAPTPAPTEAPAATPRPTVEPPASPPPAASCTLAPVGSDPVATIAYPGSWFTLDAPPEAACRFFDPEEISVPSGGGAPTTAVYAATIADTYGDAVAAATDPATWTVTSLSEVEVAGVPVTCVYGVAVADTAQVSAGQARYVCLADVAAAGTVAIGSIGTPGDEVFNANAAVAGLMTLASTFLPGT